MEVRTSEEYEMFLESLGAISREDEETRNRVRNAFYNLPAAERLAYERRKTAKIFARSTPRLRQNPEKSYERGREEHVSPSGRYRLVVTPYDTTTQEDPNTWDFTLGEVFRGDVKIFEIQRNYSHFPFGFVEDHPNGHDYLICGENYQRYNILELDTGQRLDIPPSGIDGMGFGFCITKIVPSPDRRTLAVEGCIWGGPYDVHLYEFSEPLSGPMFRMGYASNPLEYRWESDGIFHWVGETEIRKSDGKVYDDLSEEEQDKADKENDISYRKDSFEWTRPSNYEVVLKAIQKVIDSEKYATGGIVPNYQKDQLQRFLSRLSTEERDQASEHYQRSSPRGGVL